MRLREGPGNAAPLTTPIDLPDTEDKELVLAFKRGEDGSYQAIYQRYSPRVSGICRRMLNQAQDAEEAQQETFMRVYTSLSKFNGRYQLGAWVSRIATNVCLDHIRSKGRKPADSASHEMLVDLSADVDENVPEEELLKSDERQKVREVLATLSPSHRAALALREFEGMSYDDIAVALNMTEPQVKALIHRARKAFKKQWAPGLAAFLPWRWIAKVRKFSTHYDAPPQLSDAAASTMHFASSCSAALQQCGQFVSERVATTVTALVVGTAAVGVAIAPPAGHANPPPVIHQQAADEAGQQDDGRDHSPRRTPRPQRQKVAAAPVAEEPVEEPVEEPLEEPAPASSPEPADPKPQPTSSPVDGGQPAPPKPLMTQFGFDTGTEVPKTAVTSNTATFDCATRSFDQRVDTWISHGAFSYRAVLTMAVKGTFADLKMSVWKDDRHHKYTSWGASPSVSWSQDGLGITGDYGPLYGSTDPQESNLPHSGHFVANVALDCASHTVVTQGLTLTTE